MSSDIYTTPYAIYSATPGAGDWLIDCRLSGLAAGANTFTWKATVAGVTVNGAGEDATKDTAETTMQAVIPVHAAAGEAVVVTVQSDSASDTAVTATATATLASGNIPTPEEIAAAVLTYQASEVEDTAELDTLLLTILAARHSDTTTRSGYLTVFKTDGTVFAQLPLTSSASADPVTGVGS